MGFRGQLPIYQIDVGHLEFKMADRETVKKSNLVIFSNLMPSFMRIVKGQYISKISAILDSK